MSSLIQRFKHAFAFDTSSSFDPTPAQQSAVDWVCIQVAKRHLTTPGLIALEMTRPLNYITAQTMHFFRPGIWALAAKRTYNDYVHFSQFLEHRGSMEYLARRVEYFENEFSKLEDTGQPIAPFIKQHFERVNEAARSNRRENDEA